MRDFGRAKRAETAALACGRGERHLLGIEIAWPAQGLRAAGPRTVTTSPP